MQTCNYLGRQPAAAPQRSRRHTRRSGGACTAARPLQGHRQHQRPAPVARSQPEQQDPSESSSSSSSEQPAGAQQTQVKLAGEDDAALRMPKDVVERLKSTVFGYDTMWVTSVENYEADGVVFKGNVRARDVGAVYARMRQRLQAEMGDQWQLFLLQDKEEKPTAVVLPASAREGQLSRFTEVWLAVAFAVLAGLTSVNAAGAPLLQFLIDPFRTQLTLEDLGDTLPLVAAFWATLGIHEWGHAQAAARRGAELYLPLIVPAGFGFVGSFGGITRFKGFCPDREALLDVGVSGPAAGAALSAVFALTGLALSAGGLGDVTLDTPAFADSLIMGVAGQVFLGDALSQPEVRVSSLLIAGWAGLVVNALNALPVGELDGGRISLALLGRRASTALSVLSTAALAVGSFNNPLLLYWLFFVVALQRGPQLPCRQELEEPKDATNRQLGYALLALPLLVLLPYPVELAEAILNLRDPTLF